MTQGPSGVRGGARSNVRPSGPKNRGAGGRGEQEPAGARQRRRAVAEVHRDEEVPASHREDAGLLVGGAETAKAGSVSSGAPAQRGQARGRGRAARRAGALELGPVQLRARERRRVLRVGHASASQPIRANSAMPALGGRSAELGLGCEVKNCHGVDAAHSSPMQSIGVNGAARSAARARRQQVVVEMLGASRSPAARLPTWSWFCRRPTSRQVGIGRGRPGARGRGPGTTSTCRRGRSPRSQHLRQRRQRAEVGVVALPSRRSARRAARGGSRRPTARRARSRRPRAA